jgi:hypothetical protein
VRPLAVAATAQPQTPPRSVCARRRRLIGPFEGRKKKRKKKNKFV